MVINTCLNLYAEIKKPYSTFKQNGYPFEFIQEQGKNFLQKILVEHPVRFEPVTFQLHEFLQLLS